MSNTGHSVNGETPQAIPREGQSNGDKSPSKPNEEKEKTVDAQTRPDAAGSSNGDRSPSKPDEKKEEKIDAAQTRSGTGKYEEWDCAIENPPINSDDSNECWNILTKICVALLCGALFLVVLISTGLTRILIHLMIWKLNPPQINSTSTLNTLGGLLQKVVISNDCSSIATSCYRKEDFPSSWCEPSSCPLPTVNVRWIWGLVVAIVVPDVYTFLYSLWRICFKETERFHIKMFTLSLVVEILHTTGLCLLVFLVLPTFDPISASVFANLVIFIPVILSAFCKFRFSPSTMFEGITRGGKVANGTPKNDLSSGKENENKGNKLYQITQIIGLFSMLIGLGFACWYIYEKSDDETILTVNIVFVLSLVLVSFAYWENFLTLSSETEPQEKTENNSDTNGKGSISYETETAGINENNYGTNREGSATKASGTNGEGSRSSEIEPAGKNENSNDTNREGSADKSNGTNGSPETQPAGKNEKNKDTNGKGSADKASDLYKTRIKHFLANYIRSKREKVSIIVSIIKVALTIAFPYIIFAASADSDTSALQIVKTISLLGSANASIKTLTGNITLESISYSSYGCETNDLVLLFVTCIILGFISFKSARFACRVYRQRFCFALPLMLSMLGTPLVLIPVLKHPLAWTAQDCNIAQPLWELEGTSTDEIWQLIVSGCAGFVSCCLLTLYIWTNKGSKLAKCDRLFRKPPYNAIFLDLSLLLTRYKNTTEQIAEETEEEAVQSTVENGQCYYYPFVYFCATMWHETETEMTQLLKSIFKVDYDQFLQKIHQEEIKKKRKGYINEDIYEFEVHIFFDDAFKPRKGKNGKLKKGRDVNDYVKTLEEVIPNTAKSVYGGYELDAVQRYETPYGCRFEWELLTSQKLVVHLKDKTKIRHRKRWSQVMYMYYLLSFKMNELKEKMNEDGSFKKHMRQFADNTFVLALDGDVDFNPEAVTLLIDRMKKDPLVGAACGRIHPIGSGPMVWYQKFEYALSHWLQKAAEHVFGCVLCSPGCFSLFRASAVLADNVLKTYTKVPTEAVHHVQYDQGEDRWLCTLLLKQKYRVEYCAASDAMTFAPEGFFEFYNQRRRWAPSTMANILDLLMDGNNVRKVNENISRPYIFYHICMFISSILTPGTIFLLILGAITTAFPEIEPWLALLLNGLPVTIFLISIYVAKEETQLLFAAIFSTIYSLVMIVVLIGLLKEGIESQFCSVTTVFFCFVAGVFVIAAFLHPKEFACILHGFLYFLAVPSMSMLLVFYSVGNMHNVNWGTRESKTANNDESTSRNMQKRIEGQSCSLGDWCRCVLCFNEKEERYSVNSTEKRDNKGKNADQQDEEHESKTEIVNTTDGQEKQKETKKSVTIKTDGPKNNPEVKEKKGQMGPQKRGIYRECKPITNDEEEFWKALIKKYLKPLEMNEEIKSKMHKDLIDLRNKVFFFYFITNAIFVTIVYVLTQVNAYQKSLQIPLPCNVGEIQGRIEPISIAFTLVFGILLIIQFFGMLMHRVSTISHIIAATKLIGRKLDTTKIPLKKIEKPTALQEKEEEEPIKRAKKRWNIIRAGIGIRSLSGEIRQKTQTIKNLKDSITTKLQTISEGSEENSESETTLDLYYNTPITTMSIRGIQRSPASSAGPCSSNA